MFRYYQCGNLTVAFERIPGATEEGKTKINAVITDRADKVVWATSQLQVPKWITERRAVSEILDWAASETDPEEDGAGPIWDNAQMGGEDNDWDLHPIPTPELRKN